MDNDEDKEGEEREYEERRKKETKKKKTKKKERNSSCLYIPRYLVEHFLSNRQKLIRYNIFHPTDHKS